MKKQTLTALLLGATALYAGHSMAQRKPDDPKHENHYSVSPIESEDLKIEFIDPHSQQEFTHTKLKITNKTTDYLLFKSTEVVFKYEFGEVKPSSSGMFSGEYTKIFPKDVETKVVKVSGEGKNYHVQSLTFIPSGFFKVAAEGKVQEAPDFKLPAATNDFKAGNFSCKVDKVDKETKETKVVFKCVYNGTDVGFVDPNKIVVKLKSGQEYANDSREDKPKIVFPGGDVKVVATFHVPGKVEDMQFANMDLVWKNTFTESKMVPLKLPSIGFVFDPGKTEGKNK